MKGTLGQKMWSRWSYPQDSRTSCLADRFSSSTRGQVGREVAWRSRENPRMGARRETNRKPFRFGSSRLSLLAPSLSADMGSLIRSHGMENPRGPGWDWRGRRRRVSGLTKAVTKVSSRISCEKWAELSESISYCKLNGTRIRRICRFGNHSVSRFCLIQPQLAYAGRQ